MIIISLSPIHANLWFVNGDETKRNSNFQFSIFNFEKNTRYIPWKSGKLTQRTWIWLSKQNHFVSKKAKNASLLKSVTNYGVVSMGPNFYDYHDFQSKINCAYTYATPYSCLVYNGFKSIVKEHPYYYLYFYFFHKILGQ